MGIEPDDSALRKTLQGLRAITFFASPARRRELAKFTAPCLIVLGEHEALYDPHKAARRAEAMPQARVEIVPDAGHAAVFDRPAYINPIILGFLAEAEQGRGSAGRRPA